MTPGYDPREDKPAATIDTSMLTMEERAMMLAILRKGVLREVAEQKQPQEIDGQAEGRGC